MARQVLLDLRCNKPDKGINSSHNTHSECIGVSAVKGIIKQNQTTRQHQPDIVGDAIGSKSSGWIRSLP